MTTSEPDEHEHDPEHDAVWRAMADGTRRHLIDLLAEGPRSTSELVAAFEPELCRTAVMKHLDVLVRANLVVVRREGRSRWNYLNPVPIQRVCDRWVSRHVRHMASALGRLKETVEGPARTMRAARPRRRTGAKARTRGDES